MSPVSLPEVPVVQGAENSAFVRCPFVVVVVRSFVVPAAIKAIWTFSKFSLILLWKGFGGVTHRQLLDPKFARFTSKFVDFLDQKWDPKMDSFRHARRATLPCGCNLVRTTTRLHQQGMGLQYL